LIFILFKSINLRLFIYKIIYLYLSIAVQHERGPRKIKYDKPNNSFKNDYNNNNNNNLHTSSFSTIKNSNFSMLMPTLSVATSSSRSLSSSPSPITQSPMFNCFNSSSSLLPGIPFLRNFYDEKQIGINLFKSLKIKVLILIIKDKDVNGSKNFKTNEAFLYGQQKNVFVAHLIYLLQRNQQQQQLQKNPVLFNTQNQIEDFSQNYKNQTKISLNLVVNIFILIMRRIFIYLF
jgi:hypothetical protein